jgi:hypothetical protein
MLASLMLDELEINAPLRAPILAPEMAFIDMPASARYLMTPT